MLDMEDLRGRVCRANLALVEHGLVVCTWGNASELDREHGVVAIKPSGISYAELTPEQIVVVDLEGRTVAGELRPSSDLATHLELYRAFPAIGGVAHTHSRYATALAQARRELPCLGTTHADHFFGTIPVTRMLRPDEIRADYEANTGKVIVEACAESDPSRIPAILVAHHGPFTWGPTAAAAVTNSVVLEACAAMAVETWGLDPSAAGVDPALLECHFLRKHGPGAYYGQNRG